MLNKRPAGLALLTALYLANTLTSTHAFSSIPFAAFASRPTVPRSTVSSHITTVFSSDSEDAAAGEGNNIYPALSQQEIEQWLSQIPVYAVTDSKEGGVVLMTEGGDKGIAYFFVTKDAADATLDQMNASNPGAEWDVTALSLGAIWFDLLNSESAGFSESQVKSKSLIGGEVMETAVEGVEYRICPDYRDLNGARMLLSQDEQSKKALEESGRFRSSFNEIPVFMDLQIRVEKDGVEKFPMYLALQDMVTTCQQFMRSIGEDQYEAAINVAELRILVDQMQAESTVDFRKALLIPPVPGASGGAEADEPYSPSINSEW